MSNSTNPTRVAIVGAGYISDYHMAAIKTVPGVQVAAVCDLRRNAAERFAAAHGIPGVYDDLGAMLAGEELDAVHVLTPPQAHVGPAIQVLEAGVDVLLEKPFAHTVAGCRQLREAVERTGRKLGTSHNFLFTDGYEKLASDAKGGDLGQLDQVDIVWNKELGQVKGGPFSAWMLQHPSNILFEVAPHSFAHAVHLVGGLTDVSVDAKDEVELPRGLRFYRRWEIRGWAGRVSVRIRFSFVEGYAEHYVKVRGSNGTGLVDFENNTYVKNSHTPYLLDIDRFANVSQAAVQAFTQASATFGNVVLAKAGLVKSDGPFATSIASAVGSFYRTRTTRLDERLDIDVAQGAIELAEHIAELADLPAPPGMAAVEAPSESKADTLVIGGTGFIGRALVRKLVDAGNVVRVLARDPAGAPPELRRDGVELMKGDFTDPASVERAVAGIDHVYHLARGTGNTWAEYLRWDVEPTERLAEACAAAGVKRFYYASSIAIYYAGEVGGTITEETKTVAGMLRANPYANSKAENEIVLERVSKKTGMPLVIFRPGIVLGSGGSPFHWGVAAWPYKSVCNLYGSGNNPLPIVLVDDCADAMTAAKTADGVEGESFNLTTDPCITANEYLDAFERRAGITVRRIPTPGWRSYGSGLVKYAIKAIGKDPAAVLPNYADWKGRDFAAVFDASKAERVLGWSPVKDKATLIREGIDVPVDEHFELGGDVGESAPNEGTTSRDVAPA